MFTHGALGDSLLRAAAHVLGGMPPGTEIVTVFSAAVCAASAQPEAARALLAFLRSPACTDTKRRHGMEPA